MSSETISDDDALEFVKESGVDRFQMFDLNIIGEAGAGYYEQKTQVLEVVTQRSLFSSIVIWS
jgi:hypothetical protein